MPAKTISASDAFTLYMAARYGSGVSQTVKSSIKKLPYADMREAGRVLVNQTTAGAKAKHVKLARTLAKNVAFNPILIVESSPKRKTSKIVLRKKEHAPSTSSGSKHRPQS